MKILISATSTADLTDELIKEYNIPIIHFSTEKEGKTYRDDTFSTSELFEFTKNTKIMCHTAAPNIGEYENFFKKQLNENDYLIHFTMSSKLSGCYNNAIAAANNNPHIKIIDSKGTSGATSLLVLYAIKLNQAGYDFDTICKKCEERIPYLSTSFIIKDLDYLYKGGRCTALKFYATKLLKLRPVIEINNDGAFVIGKIYRGNSQKCIKKYVEDRINSYNNLDFSAAYINISTCDEETINEVKKYLIEKGFKKVYFSPASPTNSYHAGPSVLGVQFFYDGEHNVTTK
ncbi:MAG TPA: hypothetical protein DDW20_00800 [Firmicutes bacterium]|nr:hypothetical protein [Bacillota bacterium]